MDSESSTRLVKAGVAGKPSPAHLLVDEQRLLTSLLRWVLRRHQANAPGEFAYHHGKTIIVFTFVGLGGLEGVGLHLVLLYIFGSRWWIWTIFALDMYTLVWLLGLHASMVVLPHRIEAGKLRLRHAHNSELVVDRAAVRGARIVAESQAKIGKLVVDATGRGVYCSAGSTVAIDLDPEIPLQLNGLRVTDRITTLHITADAPRRFVDALSTMDRVG